MAPAALNSQTRAATIKATVACKALTSGSDGDSGRGVTEPKGKRVLYLDLQPPFVRIVPPQAVYKSICAIKPDPNGS